MHVRHLAFAAILAASPLTAAFAQGSTGPDTKAGSTTESTAIKNGSATNPNQPGATGSTVVPGDKSTVAGAHSGTSEQKVGGVGGGK